MEFALEEFALVEVHNGGNGDDGADTGERLQISVSFSKSVQLI